MEYIVTSIAQAKKNIERVNLYLDNEFWIGLDKDNLIKYGLFKGMKLDEAKKKEIEKASVDGKLLEKAMNFIMIRPRSVKEMQDYLVLRRGLTAEESQSFISILQSRGYLSDLEFTKWYSENRLASGFHGINKIKAELIKKGVSSEIINSVLSEKKEESKDDQAERIKEYIKKVSKSIKSKDQYEFKNKLIQRLMSRGYGYDQVKSVLSEMGI